MFLILSNLRVDLMFNCYNFGTSSIKSLTFKCEVMHTEPRKFKSEPVSEPPKSLIEPPKIKNKPYKFKNEPPKFKNEPLTEPHEFKSEPPNEPLTNHANLKVNHLMNHLISMNHLLGGSFWWFIGGLRVVYEWFTGGSGLNHL